MIALPPPRLPLDASLLQPYDFGDCAFVTGAHGVPKSPVYHHLARRCVALAKGFLVKEGETWAEHGSQTVAMANLFQRHGGVHDGLTIDGNAIKDFFGASGGLVPFSGTCVVPGAAELLVFKGARLVNLYRDTRMQPDDEALHDAEIILRLIYENLCEGPTGIKFESIFDAINEPGVFRWVIHWIAAIYQRPGNHIGTMLWFLGRNNGVGKGTLFQIVEHLIGPRWCRKATGSEVDRGWTDFAMGKLVIFYDEFEAGSRRDLNRYFKEAVGNPTLELTKRNIGQIEVPNTLNAMGSTNKLSPLDIDAADRRHMFVKTSDDLSLNFRPMQFWDMPEDRRRRAIAGFGAMLAAIEIDDALIRRPIETEARTMIIDDSMGPVMRWLRYTDEKWRPGRENAQAARELWHGYLRWMELEDPNAGVKTETAFGRVLREIANIEKSRTKTGNRYWKIEYFCPEENKPPEGESADDHRWRLQRLKQEREDP